LQRQLALLRYETAWVLLHKLRRIASPLQIAAGARSFSTIRGGKLYGAR
jgi:hypothetical protein